MSIENSLGVEAGVTLQREGDIVVDPMKERGDIDTGVLYGCVLLYT